MANAIPGKVADNGEVRCNCGKKVGEVGSEGVAFWCSACRAPVEVRFNEMKLGGMLSAVAAVQNCVATLNKALDLIAIMQPTASPA